MKYRVISKTLSNGAEFSVPFKDYFSAEKYVDSIKEVTNETKNLYTRRNSEGNIVIFNSSHDVEIVRICSDDS